MRRPGRSIRVPVHHGRGESHMDLHSPLGKGFCTPHEYKVSVRLCLLSASLLLICFFSKGTNVMFSYKIDSSASPTLYTYEHLSLILRQGPSYFHTMLCACGLPMFHQSPSGRLSGNTVDSGISELLSRALTFLAIWSKSLFHVSKIGIRIILISPSIELTRAES